MLFKWRDDVIASRSGLKIRWSKDREGWSPSRATIFSINNTSGFQKRTHDNRFGFLLRTVFEENYDLGVAT